MGRHELIDSGTPARTDSWQSGFFFFASVAADARYDVHHN